MKRFIAVVLNISTLMTFTPKSVFAIKAQCTRSGNNLITVTINKPVTYPWTNNDMTAHCLGVLEVKIKNPQNLMQNTTIQVKANKEPLKYFNWSNIDWKNSSIMQRTGIILKVIFDTIFFQRSFKRKYVNSFKLTGLPVQVSWYNVPERLLNWLFDRRIPIEYRLIQIDPDKVKKLTANFVRPGQKKPEVINNEDIYKNIQNLNGKSDVVKLRDELLKRALSALNNPNVDSYDPFNVIENGNFLKLGDYKEQIDTSLYYSKKETDEKNKEIESEKKKICDEFAQIYNEDLKSQGVLGTLSAEKPSLNFAIVVNDNIDDSAESYKLSHFLAINGHNFLKSDKSIIEFDAQKLFTVPESGLPADEEQRNRALADIEATKAKPGFKQWTKNKFGTFVKGAKFILPQFVTDFIGSVCELLGLNLGGNYNGTYLVPDDNEHASEEQAAGIHQQNPQQPGDNVGAQQGNGGNGAVQPNSPPQQPGGNVGPQQSNGGNAAAQQNPQQQQNPPQQQPQQQQADGQPNVVVNVIQNQQQNQNNRPQLAVSDPQIQVH